jgi:hypothetical protein
MVVSQIKYLVLAAGLLSLPVSAITKEERIKLLGESAKGMMAPPIPATLHEPQIAQPERPAPVAQESTDLKKFEESIPAVSEETNPLKNLEKAVQSTPSTALIDSIVDGLNRVAALQTLYYRQSLTGNTAVQPKPENKNGNSRKLDPLTASAYNPPLK